MPKNTSLCRVRRVVPGCGVSAGCGTGQVALERGRVSGPVLAGPEGLQASACAPPVSAAMRPFTRRRAGDVPCVVAPLAPPVPAPVSGCPVARIGVNLLYLFKGGAARRRAGRPTAGLRPPAGPGQAAHAGSAPLTGKGHPGQTVHPRTATHTRATRSHSAPPHGHRTVCGPPTQSPAATPGPPGPQTAHPHTAFLRPHRTPGPTDAATRQPPHPSPPSDGPAPPPQTRQSGSKPRRRVRRPLSRVSGIAGRYT